MKKKTFVVIGLLLITTWIGVTPAKAIGGDGKLTKGAQSLGFGVGFKGLSGILSGPHLSLRYDYAVLDNIFKNQSGALTVGAFYGTTIHPPRGYIQGGFYMHWDCRVALHWQFAKSWDFYSSLQAGIGLLMQKAFALSLEPNALSLEPNTKQTTTWEHSLHFSGDYALGMRYSFTDNWHIWLELSPGWIGASLPWIALGVNYTF